MAKTPQNVEKFLEGLINKIHDKGQKDILKLSKLKQEFTQNKDAEYRPWDFTFYDAMFKKKVYHIEEEKIREYFPSEHVKQATMDIYQKLLGLTFTKMENAEVWEPSVSKYEVTDTETKELLGHFYLDLYPRPNKFNHAACFGLIQRATVDGEV